MSEAVEPPATVKPSAAVKPSAVAKSAAVAKPVAKTKAAAMDEIPAVLTPAELIILMLAVAGGALAAAGIIPTWLPGLTDSVMGDQPQAYWYLARASGVVAYLVLWLSIVFGLVVSNKMARLWNGGPTAVELHQFTTWLAIAFGLFHALILMGDTYIKATLAQVLTPFAYSGYEPFWVGLGQIAFYLAVIVAASFYVRKRIGYRTWRTLHYVSFALFLLLTVHGIFAGTDTSVPAMWYTYTATSVCVYFLVIVRIFSAVRAPRPVPHASNSSIARTPPAR